jgi:hypothetical protein
MTHQAAGFRTRLRLGPHLPLLALLFVAATATMTLRELAIGKAEMAAADEAFTRSAWTDAIGHARAAAEAFVPGGPWVDRGMQRLDAIGKDAAIRGDRSTALLAYGAMRTAALATRAPGSPSADWRPVAEDGLARLAASDPEIQRSDAWASAARSDLSDPSLPSQWVLGALSCSVLAVLLGLASLGASAWKSSDTSVARILIGFGAATYAISLLLS